MQFVFYAEASCTRRVPTFRSPFQWLPRRRGEHDVKRSCAPLGGIALLFPRPASSSKLFGASAAGTEDSDCRSGCARVKHFGQLVCIALLSRNGCVEATWAAAMPRNTIAQLAFLALTLRIVGQPFCTAQPCGTCPQKARPFASLGLLV